MDEPCTSSENGTSSSPSSAHRWIDGRHIFDTSTQSSSHTNRLPNVYTPTWRKTSRYLRRWYRSFFPSHRRPSAFKTIYFGHRFSPTQRTATSRFDLIFWNAAFDTRQIGSLAPYLVTQAIFVSNGKTDGATERNSETRDKTRDTANNEIGLHSPPSRRHRQYYYSNTAPQTKRRTNSDDTKENRSKTNVKEGNFVSVPHSYSSQQHSKVTKWTDPYILDGAASSVDKKIRRRAVGREEMNSSDDQTLDSTSKILPSTPTCLVHSTPIGHQVKALDIGHRSSTDIGHRSPINTSLRSSLDVGHRSSIDTSHQSSINTSFRSSMDVGHRSFSTSNGSDQRYGSPIKHPRIPGTLADDHDMSDYVSSKQTTEMETLISKYGNGNTFDFSTILAIDHTVRPPDLLPLMLSDDGISDYDSIGPSVIRHSDIIQTNDILQLFRWLILGGWTKLTNYDHEVAQGNVQFFQRECYLISVAYYIMAIRSLPTPDTILYFPSVDAFKYFAFNYFRTVNGRAFDISDCQHLLPIELATTQRSPLFDPVKYFHDQYKAQQPTDKSDISQWTAAAQSKRVVEITKHKRKIRDRTVPMATSSVVHQPLTLVPDQTSTTGKTIESQYSFTSTTVADILCDIPDPTIKQAWRERIFRTTGRWPRESKIQRPVIDQTLALETQDQNANFSSETSEQQSTTTQQTGVSRYSFSSSQMACIVAKRPNDPAVQALLREGRKIGPSSIASSRTLRRTRTPIATATMAVQTIEQSQNQNADHTPDTRRPQRPTSQGQDTSTGTRGDKTRASVNQQRLVDNQTAENGQNKSQTLVGEFAQQVTTMIRDAVGQLLPGHQQQQQQPSAVQPNVGTPVEQAAVPISVQQQPLQMQQDVGTLGGQLVNQATAQHQPLQMQQHVIPVGQTAVLQPIQQLPLPIQIVDQTRAGQMVVPAPMQQQIWQQPTVPDTRTMAAPTVAPLATSQTVSNYYQPPPPIMPTETQAQFAVGTPEQQIDDSFRGHIKRPRMIDKYNPQNPNMVLTEWIDEFQLAYYNQTPEDQASMLPWFLEGTAVTTYASFSPQVRNDITLALTALRRAYQPAMDYDIALRYVKECVQRPDETARDYYDRLFRLVRKVFPEENDTFKEREIRRQYLLGLRPSTRRPLRLIATCQDWPSSDLRERAYAIEQEQSPKKQQPTISRLQYPTVNRFQHVHRPASKFRGGPSMAQIERQQRLSKPTAMPARRAQQHKKIDSGDNQLRRSQDATTNTIVRFDDKMSRKQWQQLAAQIRDSNRCSKNTRFADTHMGNASASMATNATAATSHPIMVNASTTQVAALSSTGTTIAQPTTVNTIRDTEKSISDIVETSTMTDITRVVETSPIVSTIIGPSQSILTPSTASTTTQTITEQQQVKTLDSNQLATANSINTNDKSTAVGYAIDTESISVDTRRTTIDKRPQIRTPVGPIETQDRAILRAIVSDLIDNSNHGHEIPNFPPWFATKPLPTGKTKWTFIPVTDEIERLAGSLPLPETDLERVNINDVFNIDDDQLLAPVLRPTPLQVDRAVQTTADTRESAINTDFYPHQLLTLEAINPSKAFIASDSDEELESATADKHEITDKIKHEPPTINVTTRRQHQQMLRNSEPMFNDTAEDDSCEEGDDEDDVDFAIPETPSSVIADADQSVKTPLAPIDQTLATDDYRRARAIFI